MKFCLYDFFAEGTVEIGSTSLIDIDSLGDGEGANFTNEQWNFSREVMVKWPAAANNTSIAGNKPTPKYVARVVCFADDRRDSAMLEKCKQLTDRPTVKQTTRLGRQQKRPQRFVSEISSEEEEAATSASADKRQLKQKKAKVVSVRDNALLARLAKKKEATKEIEQSDTQKMRGEYAALKEEVKKVTKERDTVVAAMACLKELPELLRQLKDTKEPRAPLTKGQSSPSYSTAGSSSSSSPHSSSSGKKKASMVMKPATTAPPKYLQDLMTKAFSREEMASHSLTGVTSNANGPAKEACPQINPAKMEEIFNTVQTQFPDFPKKNLREAARNKLSNERKLFKKAKISL